MSDRSDNAAAKAEAARYVQARFASWWEHNQDAMKRLITEYSDDDALTLFERMRERFWSRL